MADPLKIGHLYPRHALALHAHKQAPADKPSAAGGKFQDALHAAQLKFSHHAEMRMQQRGISLKTEQLSQIVQALEQAEAKGAKDSLVLFRDIAMIVNVPSKTVVTAMEGRQMMGNVFTQIDSAVVIA